mgnify:CR=1 FL=1
MTRKQKSKLTRIIVAAVLTVAIAVSPAEGLTAFFLYLIPYGIVAYDILLKAAKNIARGQVFDENFLMAVASLGALAIGVAKTGDFLEAVAVILFYQVGELFESIAVGKSRKNISALMDIRPDYANLEGPDGEFVRVDPDEVPVGSIIVVQPGEKVAIDGVVESGTSTLDTGALTGESVPRDVHPGEDIISGCINMTGVLRVRTTREFGESTVSKILDLVENASSRKSQSENFISKFARYYTPAVCFGALAVAILPPLVRLLALGLAPEWSTWIYRALTFLVISCPCALVISIPLSFFAGIGGASRAGILVKGSNYLEALAKTGVAVFDKTGTLTRGSFEVTQVLPANGFEPEALLELAAMVRHMNDCRKTYSSGLIVVALDGKEKDLAGSAALWRQIDGKRLKDPLTGAAIGPGQISLVVNLDQLGASLAPLTKGNPDYLMMLSEESSGRRSVLESVNRNEHIGLELGYDYYGSKDFTTLFYRRISDQRVFLENGIPAVMFTSGITFNNNKPQDDAASLDYPVLRKRIQLIFYYLDKVL